jgi:hypothetical protein
VAEEANDRSVERLKELLDYVGQVIKLDERPAFKLSEYRLGNGQTFLFHEHELHAVPGITHDLTDEDGAVWLCAERLKRNDPPKPSENLAPWLDLSPDPDRTPLPPGPSPEDSFKTGIRGTRCFRAGPRRRLRRIPIGRRKGAVRRTPSSGRQARNREGSRAIPFAFVAALVRR